MSKCVTQVIQRDGLVSLTEGSRPLATVVPASREGRFYTEFRISSLKFRMSGDKQGQSVGHDLERRRQSPYQLAVQLEADCCLRFTGAHNPFSAHKFDVA